MGNIISHLRRTISLGECENDKAIHDRNNGVSTSVSTSTFENANNHLTTDQPDSVAHIREESEEQEEIYVQFTVCARKLRTQKDGTITLSPISESIVS